MIFWDTSSIIPLVVHEPSTLSCEALLRLNALMVVWWGTRIEALSALNRRFRDRTLAPEGTFQARRVLDALALCWSEILPTEAVRGEAERAIGVHGLKTLDAFQLAAALVWSGGRPRSFAFACLDHRLREAAQKEGFELVPE